MWIVLFDSLSLSLSQEVSDLADVEISADSVASLVTSGHDLHIGAEEETSHTWLFLSHNMDHSALEINKINNINFFNVVI